MNNNNRPVPQADPSHDGENFSNRKVAHAQNKTQKTKSNKGFSFNRSSRKPIIIVLIVLAVLLLIGLVVALLIFAPSKHNKLKDNAFLPYTDSNGVHHVLFNGNSVGSFTGDIKLYPANDNSFAYVFEKSTDSNGVKAYIIKNGNLEKCEISLDEFPEGLCEYAHGIVYRNGDVYYDAPGNLGLLSKSNEATNFIVSDDAKVVVFNDVTDDDSEKLVLKYSTGGLTKIIPLNNEYIPVEISRDGRYIFVTTQNKFGYIEVDPSNPEEVKKAVIITTQEKHGKFQAITGSSADGTEVIFYTDTKGEIKSYRYKIGNDSAVELISAGGIFRPINADSYIVAPQTFMDTYFECEKTTFVEDEDEDLVEQTVISTYYLGPNGAVEIAKARGQFSPDQRYFYYIDSEDYLCQIDLGNKEFKSEKIRNNVSGFHVIDKSHVYITYNISKNNKLCKITYWDPFSRNGVSISEAAEIASIRTVANSIYFLDYSNGAETPTLCVSTNGAAKTAASFKDADTTSTIEVVMYTRNCGYAIAPNASGSQNIYFTNNGKDFELVASGEAKYKEFINFIDNTPVTLPDEEDEEDE